MPVLIEGTGNTLSIINEIIDPALLHESRSESEQSQPSEESKKINTNDEEDVPDHISGEENIAFEEVELKDKLGKGLRRKVLLATRSPYLLTIIEDVEEFVSFVIFLFFNLYFFHIV